MNTDYLNSTQNAEQIPNIQPLGIPAQPANVVPNNEDNSEEAKLKREADVGEHDIVIEEDFEINLDVSPVSDDSALFAPVRKEEEQKANSTVELGTEQTGNITF